MCSLLPIPCFCLLSFYFLALRKEKSAILLNFIIHKAQVNFDHISFIAKFYIIFDI